MKTLFLQYPRCTTCKRAKAWLEQNGIEFIDRDITIDNPTEEELKKWYEMSGLKLKSFFNTSGIVYRELNLKDKLKDMTEDEMIALLATNGKLVKRPIVIKDSTVLVGFKEPNYEQLTKQYKVIRGEYMKNLFVNQPECNTCTRAREWLMDNNVEFTHRHIINENPTKEEITKWHNKSNVELMDFFKINSELYKSQGFTDKLQKMSKDDMLELLASDGGLLKRPILINDDGVILGFDEKLKREI